MGYKRSKTETPIYYNDVLVFYEDFEIENVLKTKILIESETTSTYYLESLELFLGLFIGLGIHLLAHLIHDLKTKKKYLGEREFDDVEFQFLDQEKGIVINYKGPISGLEIIDSKITDNYPELEEEQLVIIENLNTGYPDSTNFIKNELKKNVSSIIPLEVKNFRNFCRVLEFLVKTMHIDADNYNYLNESADEYWEKHKNDLKIQFEKKWFQPKLQQIYQLEFGVDVKKEVEEVRGYTDFHIFNLPIEAKVFTDRAKYAKLKSGIEILEEFELQSFQETMHTRCGFLITYDYRKETVSNELRIQSIIERIKFRIYGEKIIVLIVLLGSLQKPSSLKK